MNKIPERFVIHIAAPSCCGKSSTFESLRAKLPEAYTISYDKLKWQVSRYHRDLHKALVKKLALGFFEVVCKEHIPVFLETMMEDEAEYATYKGIAEEHGYVFLSIELTAPIEVLLSRFRQRIEEVKKEGRKISVMDEEVFLSQTSKRKFVHESTPVWDTSTADSDSIANDVIKLLSSS